MRTLGAETSVSSLSCDTELFQFTPSLTWKCKGSVRVVSVGRKSPPNIKPAYAAVFNAQCTYIERCFGYYGLFRHFLLLHLHGDVAGSGQAPEQSCSWQKGEIFGVVSFA